MQQWVSLGYKSSLLPQASRSRVVSTSVFLSNILLLLIFVSLTFRFQLRVPGEGYYATFANLLIVMLGGTFVFYKLRYKIARIKTKLDLPFLVFSIAIVIGLVNGALANGLSQGFLSDMRAFIQFFFFFIVTSIRFNQRTFSKFLIRLFIVIIISAIIVSVFSILIAALNFDHPLDTANPWEFHEQDIGGIKRSVALIPSAILIITPVILISLLYLKKLSIWQFVGIFLLNLIGVFFTFTRSIWIGIIISLLAFGFLNRAQVWKILFEKIIILIVVLGVLLIAIQVSFHVDFIDLIAQRTGVIFIDSPYEIGSVAYRIAESESFVELFLKNPGIGSGLGAEITFYSLAFKDYVTRTNWHNAYAMLLGKLGIFGLLGFIYILWGVFHESLYILRHAPNMTTKVLITTFLSILLAVIVTTFSISSLIHVEFTILFVTLSAIIGIYGHYLRDSLKVTRYGLRFKHYHH